MHNAEMLRYPVISDTGEPDAFKRCTSGSERGGWKRTRKGNALAAYSTEWIAELLQHGLLRPSFIPPAWQRALRTLTRSRASLTQERSRTIARLQKELEDANIKLAAVASDLMGKSARAYVAGLTCRRSRSSHTGGIRSRQDAVKA